MKLSCVTATFNAIKSGNRDRLIRCVESVAALETEHEHLIFDGASTDGTVELLRELAIKTPGVKVVSEKDSGIYNALNKGVREASGEWFYVLGCDDFISKPAVMDRLLREENAKTDVIVTSVSEESESGEIISHKFTSLKDFGNFFRGCVCCHQGEIMKTALARALGGFDERYRVSADTNMFWHAHLRGARFHYVFREFATFHLGGTADSNAETYKHEDRLCIESALQLSPKEVKYFEVTGFLPTSRLLRLMLHRDVAVRIGSYYMFRAWIKWQLVRAGILQG